MPLPARSLKIRPRTALLKGPIFRSACRDTAVGGAEYRLGFAGLASTDDREVDGDAWLRRLLRGTASVGPNGQRTS